MSTSVAFATEFSVAFATEAVAFATEAVAFANKTVAFATDQNSPILRAN